jgi:hypothetical protein
VSRKVGLRLLIGFGTSLIVAIFISSEDGAAMLQWGVAAVIIYLTGFVAIQLLGDRLFAPENRKVSQWSAIVAGFSSVFLNRFLPSGPWMIVLSALVMGSFFGLAWVATGRRDVSSH